MKDDIIFNKYKTKTTSDGWEVAISDKQLKKAIEEARADEKIKYTKLIQLWERLIILDSRNWKSSNWENYSKEWDKIEKEAKAEIEKLSR